MASLWRAVRNALGAALFFVIAPGLVAGLLPFLMTRWRVSEPFLGTDLTRWAGAVLVAPGLVFLVDAFIRFVREGRGTPAPVAAPRHLVVRGPYRWVRNPMYVALVAIVVGQALVLGSTALLIYVAVVALTFHTFVVLYEEPTLRERFGTEYDAYAARVPRWIPRPPR
jgi:protein-S-isoprenylcysteine O-methyltransferase Ste14